MTSARTRIAARFEKQHCVIVKRQALEDGLSHRQIDGQIESGAWKRIHRATYRLEGSPRTFEQRVMAAVLAAGADCVASGPTAAAIWRLPGFSPGIIEITSLRQVRVQGIRARRTRCLADHDRRIVAGIPVTAPTRTLLDLVQRFPKKMVARALDNLVARDLLTIPTAWRELNRIGTRGHRNSAALRGMFVERLRRGGRAESVSETDLHDLLTTQGIGGWRPQVRIFDELGGFVARPDVVFIREKLVIEMLSWSVHGSRERQRLDARRQNELERLGYTVLQFYWEDITFDSHYLIEQVVSTLTGLRSQH